MTFELIMWYGVEKFLQGLQLCFQDLFDHGSYAWIMNITKVVVECKFKAILKGNQLVFYPWYIPWQKGTPMLLLLQIDGFETMVLWLSNRFDLETHQKVNICIFTYKFVFCTRWAQFFIFYLSIFWSWIGKERWTWVIVVVSFLVACVMAKGEVPIVKSVGGLNDNFLDVIINIVGRFSNFQSCILSLAMQ
jgi:hypothetical protein